MLAAEAGETLGIIGRNDSGKSTLLRLLAGIYRPDCGDPYRQHVAAQEGKAALAEQHRIEGEAYRAAIADTARRWGSQEVDSASVKPLEATGQERYVYDTPHRWSIKPLRAVPRHQAISN